MEYAIPAGFMREGGWKIVVSREGAEKCVGWLRDLESDRGVGMIWGDS